MADLNVNVSGTVAGVREIIDTDLADGVINRYLNMAYYRTLPLVGKLTNCGGSDALTEIQNLLAAHFIASTRERQATSESIEGGASVTYTGDTGTGLASTTYGQQALAMDCSGRLAKAGSARASLKVYGHADIDYDSTAAAIRD